MMPAGKSLPKSRAEAIARRRRNVNEKDGTPSTARTTASSDSATLLTEGEDVLALLDMIDGAFGDKSDLYADVLGVHPTADLRQIEIAFKQRRQELLAILADMLELSMSTSNQSGDDNDADQRISRASKDIMQAVTAQHRVLMERKLDGVVMAVRILSDPDMRLAYDDMRTRRMHGRRRQRRPVYTPITTNYQSNPDDRIVSETPTSDATTLSSVTTPPRVVTPHSWMHEPDQKSSATNTTTPTSHGSVHSNSILSVHSLLGSRGLPDVKHSSSRKQPISTEHRPLQSTKKNSRNESTDNPHSKIKGREPGDYWKEYGPSNRDVIYSHDDIDNNDDEDDINNMQVDATVMQAMFQDAVDTVLTLRMTASEEDRQHRRDKRREPEVLKKATYSQRALQQQHARRKTSETVTQVASPPLKSAMKKPASPLPIPSVSPTAGSSSQQHPLKSALKKWVGSSPERRKAPRNHGNQDREQYETEIQSYGQEERHSTVNGSGKKQQHHHATRIQVVVPNRGKHISSSHAATAAGSNMAYEQRESKAQFRDAIGHREGNGSPRQPGNVTAKPGILKKVRTVDEDGMTATTSFFCNDSWRPSYSSDEDDDTDDLRRNKSRGTVIDDDDDEDDDLDATATSQTAEDETIYTIQSADSSIVRFASQSQRTGTGFSVADEILGVIHDTSRSLEQVLSVFTLREKDIRAVMGRIDQAKEQMDHRI